MKNFFHQTCLLIATFLCVVQAQAQVFEGKIIMKLEAINLPPEMEAMKSMFESEMTIYTKGSKSRIDTSNPMTGSMFILMDTTSKEVLMCMDLMGEKTAIVVNNDDYAKQ